MLAFAGTLAALPVHARTDALATTGANTGLDRDVLFSQFFAPVLNNAGGVAFLGQFSGYEVTAANNRAIFYNGTAVARTGDVAPGQGSDAWTFSSLSSLLALNDLGRVGYSGSISGPGVTQFVNDRVIYRDTTLVAREHGGSGLKPADLPTAFALGNSGLTAFKSSLSGPGVVAGVNDKAVFRSSAVVARSGDIAPGAANFPFSLSYANFGEPPATSPVAINNVGNVAYFSLLSGPGATAANNRAIYRDNTLVARTGNSAPGAGAGVRHFYFDSQRINDAGQVAFVSTLTGAGVTAENRSAIYRDDTLLVRAGNAAPGAGAGVEHLEFDDLAFNNPGQVAFKSRLAGAGVTAANDSAIYRGGSLIARAGGATPFLGAGVAYETLGAPRLNNTGQVAFRGVVSGAAVTSANNSAVFIGDGSQTIKALREGDEWGRSTVVSFSLNDNGNGRVFNDYGQLAYSATLADGTQGVFVFTPDLHWRTSSGGSWDDSAHWTVGLSPARVHDVIINPVNSLTVFGSSDAQTVRSLTIGGGRTSVATLRLSANVFGNTLLATEGVNIANGGVLTGIGTVNGGARGITTLNGGAVRVQDLTLVGGLANHGLVHGSGTLRTDLSNHAEGEFNVAGGQSIQLSGIGHTNAGRIEVMNGSLRVGGGLRNLAGTGLIVGRDATLSFNGGLVNAGTLLFSLGAGSQVFGSVANAPGGHISIFGAGNVVTFDGDLLNLGSVFTGTAATVVLAGNTSGPGAFTGPGTVQFEGTVSLGSSPALISFGGHVALGAASRSVMELGGSVRGTDYDAFDAAGTFTLGGTLDVDVLAGFNAQPGLSFDLFAAPTLAGRFAGLDLPALGGGLVWSSAVLTDANGSTDIFRLSISAVPEPAAWALWTGGLLGIGALRLRARRQAA